MGIFNPMRYTGIIFISVLFLNDIIIVLTYKLFVGSNNSELEIEEFRMDIFVERYPVELMRQYYFQLTENVH